MSLEIVLLVEPVDQPRYFDSLPSVGWEAIIQLWVGKPLKLLAGKPSITFGAGGLFKFWLGSHQQLFGRERLFSTSGWKASSKVWGGKPLWAGKPSNLVAGKPSRAGKPFTLVAGKPSNNIWAGKPSKLVAGKPSNNIWAGKPFTLLAGKPSGNILAGKPFKLWLGSHQQSLGWEVFDFEEWGLFFRWAKWRGGDFKFPVTSLTGFPAESFLICKPVLSPRGSSA